MNTPICIIKFDMIKSKYILNLTSLSKLSENATSVYCCIYKNTKHCPNPFALGRPSNFMVNKGCEQTSNTFDVPPSFFIAAQIN